MVVQRLGIDPLVAAFVLGRGIAPDDIDHFLNPSLKSALPDPFVLKDMPVAVERLARAIIRGEMIGIFGDYDVDGTVSASLFSRYLRALGTPHRVHLPDRQLEGYGPNLAAFATLKDAGSRLIVTVDCGATAHGVLSAAAEDGLEVIVLDHHLMEAIPPAVAVVNPNRPDDLSGLSMLSAGGVVFLTLVGLNRALRQAGHFAGGRAEPNLLQWLDLVGVSLVCDVMPLVGLARVLTRQGLRLLPHFDVDGPGNPGLKALAREAKLKGPAQASHFGFAIGPRINAAGRIGHAMLAFELLSTDDPLRLADLAGQLHALNGVRQDVEQTVLAEAMAQAEAAGGEHVDLPLVVAADGWHPGVIGIVASRLKERFRRPAVVIALEGPTGKGSGRSLGGVDLGAAIAAAVDAGVIVGGGGHPMAAGLTVARDGVDAFRAFLAETLGDATARARADRALVLDGVIGVGGISKTLAEHLSAAGPFGNANPEPRFAIDSARIRNLRPLKEKHLALTIEDRQGRTGQAIAFGVIGTPLGDALSAAAADRRLLHLAGRVKADDYRGGDAGQFQIEDAAFAIATAE